MSLVPRLTYGDLDLTDHPFMWEFGGDLGAPQNVSELVESLLQDGEIMSTRRRSNREITLTVLIEDADMIALAQAEASLVAEADKAFNTLTVDPGDGLGAATVFETFTAQVQLVRDDDFEQNGVRRYVLSVPAAPFGRSESETVVAAVVSDPVPVTTTINDCSAATSWQAYAGVPPTGPYAPTSDGSTLAISADVSTGGSVPDSLVYTPGAPVSMSSTPYFSLDWRLAGVTSDYSPTVYADGVELVRISTAAIPSSSYLRSLYLCPDTSVASFRITAPREVEPSGTSYFGDLFVDQIVKTNQAPSSSTLRQKNLALKVGGSARTQGSIAVEHETSALGDVLVYSYPDRGDGYTPSLRQWRSSSNPVTPDSSLVSGGRNDWPATVYTIPQRTLRPGPYLLLARVRHVVAVGDYPLTAALTSGSTTTGVVSIPTVDVWGIYTVGLLVVPDHVSESAFSEVLTLSGANSNMQLDEAWLFYVGDDAHLTQVSLGTAVPSSSGSSNRLWIDTPTLTRPYPALWRGTQADRSDARPAADGNAAWGDHELPAGGVTVFTVTSNALDAATSGRFYKRWHTNAVD